MPARALSPDRTSPLSGPRPSTRTLWRESRARGKSVWQFIHGYVYARWTYGYIGSAIGERRALLPLRLLFAPFLAKALSSQRWAASYHGKVVPTEQARRLVRIDQAIDTLVPEQVIPFPAVRELVLSRNMPIVVLDCPCRVARENPCYPLDVCLIMGDPFASFVLEHHPQRTRAIDQDEAVAILEAEAARGHVHHVFFKEAMLDRFYAICNCCSCCCGAMTAHQHGTPMLISSGYVATVDGERCEACGTCASRCPFGSITLQERAVVDEARCMGCGVCVSHCPQEAIALRRGPTKSEPLDVQQLCAHDNGL
jgi:ferredoxin